MSEQDSGVIPASPTEQPVAPVTAEPQADAAEEPIEPANTSEQDAADAEPDVEQLPKGVKKRIDTLTRQRYERDARIAELEAKLAANTPQPKEPSPADYADFDSFLEAKAQYLADQKLSEATKQQQHDAVLQAKAQSFNERAASFRSAAADFDQSIAAIPAELMKPDMVETVLEIDEGPQVAYHLSKNLHECARIASLSGRQQAIEIGKLAAKLASQPAVKPVTPSPAPAPRVKTNTAPVQKSISEMTDAEYREYRLKQDIAAGRRR